MMYIKIIYFVHGTTYDNASKKCSVGNKSNLMVWEENKLGI